MSFLTSLARLSKHVPEGPEAPRLFARAIGAAVIVDAQVRCGVDARNPAQHPPGIALCPLNEQSFTAPLRAAMRLPLPSTLELAAPGVTEAISGACPLRRCARAY